MLPNRGEFSKISKNEKSLLFIMTIIIIRIVVAQSVTHTLESILIHKKLASFKNYVIETPE